MANNSFGQIFQIHSFGESHGKALGVVIDGCPAGVEWNEKLLLQEMNRRRPGFQPGVSERKESDRVEVLSGVFEGKTLGTPIAMVTLNQDARSDDYQKIKSNPRTGHADDVWKHKFGHVDHRGGGRASGRETVSRVMAGSVARMFLHQVLPEFKMIGFSKTIGEHMVTDEMIQQINWEQGSIENFVARFPSRDVEMEKYLNKLKDEGDSVGGIAEFRIKGLPMGLGEPVFHKLKSDLSAAILSVGATDAIAFGSFEKDFSSGVKFHKLSENYAGIRGGISTSEPIQLQVRFKPTSSILDTAKQGRHDPCIVIRAIPVIEAMICLVLADHLLLSRLNRVQ